METEMMNFKPIHLDEMSNVKLMNRIDRKFWFHAAELQAILLSVMPFYKALKIGESSRLSYATTYFDTPDNILYRLHHNGKLNRIKIRRRTYLETDLSFLEIKFKTNKGRTIKRRMPTTLGEEIFTITEGEFIQANTSFMAEELIPGLTNAFSRTTLVSIEMNERCTIDTGIKFGWNLREKILSNLVVVEVKSAGRTRNSPLVQALHDHGIRESGFSKYCVGKMAVDPNVKHNAFKAKMRTIDKHILNRAS